MKKFGILNGQLIGVIGRMGHGDSILIGDAGMPIPEGVEIIDLALKEGVVGFLETLEAVLEELEVEEALIASEMKDQSPKLHKDMENLINNGFKLEELVHENLKLESKKCKAAIRTGEFTSYANIILKSGVVF